MQNPIMTQTNKSLFMGTWKVSMAMEIIICFASLINYIFGENQTAIWVTHYVYPLPICSNASTLNNINCVFP